MAYNSTNGNRKIGDRVLTLENAFATIAGDIAGLESRMNTSFSKLENLFTHISDEKSSSKKFTISLFVAAGPIIVACFVGLWFVMTLQMNALNAPIKENLNGLNLSSAQVVNSVNTIVQEVGVVKVQAAASITDREHLNSDFNQLQGRLNDLDKQVAANKALHDAKETEIETQFNLDAQIRNVQFSEQQRLNALMWNAHKTLGTYPTAPFYQPNVSQHSMSQVQQQ